MSQLEASTDRSDLWSEEEPTETKGQLSRKNRANTVRLISRVVESCFKQEMRASESLDWSLYIPKLREKDKKEQEEKYGMRINKKPQ